MIIFAIDPGLGGAWAVIVDGRPAILGDMPVAGEGTKRRVSASVLGQLMRDGHPDLCVVETANSMPKQGVSSTFRFGMAFGAAVAVPGVLGIPVELVTPQVWKRHFRLLGENKEAARQKALDLAPQISASLSRKKDDGRAEALLIGLYGAATWDADRPRVINEAAAA